MRSLLVELIETTGASVIGCADKASVAIADIAALHPDAVTIDLILKTGSGFDVLEALANNNQGKPPLRIVLTNCISAEHRDAAKALNAEYFFDKAMQMREVIALLQSLTRSDHSQRDVAAH
jgi:CheY-like chemotaxis protein